MKHAPDHNKQTIIQRVIPLVKPTQAFFNAVLGEGIFTPEMWKQAEKLPAFRPLLDKPKATDTGLSFQAWHTPKSISPVSGVTAFCEPTNEGLLAHRLYAGPKVSGLMLIYQLSCCSSAGKNAVVMYPQGGDMKTQMRPSEEGYVNGHGFDFVGKTRVAGANALEGLECMWNEFSGRTCSHGHNHASMDTASLDRGSRVLMDISPG